MLVLPPLQRILAVDDDRFMRAAIEKSLVVGGGYDAHVCASAAEALAVARDFAPDLLLLDLVMPGLDGPATLEALRALPGTATTPVAFLTASANEPTTEVLRSLGAIAVLKKPFAPASLATDLELAWAGTQVHEEIIPETRLKAEMETLSLQYALSLPIEMTRVKTMARKAFQASGGPEDLIGLRNAVHTLHGSGASFGFDAVTEAAIGLGSELDRLIGAGRALEASQCSTLEALLATLQQATHAAALSETLEMPDAPPPVATLGADTATEPNAVATETPTSPRVLVVDDDELVRRRYALALSAAGFIADEASSGEEALALGQQHPYDLILMDLHMPGMDGFEAQRQFRLEATTRHTPILFLSATQAVSMEQARQAVAHGVSGFVPKSLHLPRVLEEIRTTLASAA